MPQLPLLHVDKNQEGFSQDRTCSMPTVLDWRFSGVCFSFSNITLTIYNRNVLFSQFGFNEYEFQQALGDCVGQGSLVYCSPQGHKKMNMTE